MSKKRIYWWNKWTAGSILILLMVLNPILYCCYNLFYSPCVYLNHLIVHSLPFYFVYSLILLIGVVFSTFVIGVSMAWLVSIYDFPGRKYFEWLLILPLAFPSYMMGYSYVGLLEYTGPLATFIRNTFHWEFVGPIIDIMNMPGAIFVLSITLYPYVYVICRASFLRQSATFQEAAFLLGSNRRRVISKIALRMARPAIAAGNACAGMELLNVYVMDNYIGI